jgi:hypothetical protein
MVVSGAELEGELVSRVLKGRGSHDLGGGVCMWWAGGAGMRTYMRRQALIKCRCYVLVWSCSLMASQLFHAFGQVNAVNTREQ